MQNSKLHKNSIWVVDDNPDHFELIMDVIHDITEKFSIIHKFNGEEAYHDLLTAISHQHPLPSLIIMDIKMPRMNGIETLSAIKENSALKGIPIVMLSTSTNQSEMDICLRSGAVLFITKPLNPRYFEEYILPLANL